MLFSEMPRQKGKPTGSSSRYFKGLCVRIPRNLRLSWGVAGAGGEVGPISRQKPFLFGTVKPMFSCEGATDSEVSRTGWDKKLNQKSAS